MKPVQTRCGDPLIAIYCRPRSPLKVPAAGTFKINMKRLDYLLIMKQILPTWIAKIRLVHNGLACIKMSDISRSPNLCLHNKNHDELIKLSNPLMIRLRCRLRWFDAYKCQYIFAKRRHAAKVDQKVNRMRNSNHRFKHAKNIMQFDELFMSSLFLMALSPKSKRLCTIHQLENKEKYEPSIVIIWWL